LVAGQGREYTMEHENGKVQSIAIKYCIKALENMPGRKYLILISSDVGWPENTSFNPDYS
jgi:hypothetical protein